MTSIFLPRNGVSCFMYMLDGFDGIQYFIPLSYLSQSSKKCLVSSVDFLHSQSVTQVGESTSCPCQCRWSYKREKPHCNWLICVLLDREGRLVSAFGLTAGVMLCSVRPVDPVSQACCHFSCWCCLMMVFACDGGISVDMSSS